MLLLSLLFCSSFFATASSALGPWGRVNSFVPDSQQLPLRVVSEFPEAEKNVHRDTVWGFISNDSRFSKLTKAIRFADDVHYYDDTSYNITFFATPDWALKRPDRNDHSSCSDLSILDDLNEDDMATFAITHRCHWYDVMAAAEDLDGLSILDDKKEQRKKLFKLLIHAALAYESLPGERDVYSLGQNTTYPTYLRVPHLREGEPLRVRVEQRILPPSTNINFYSKIVDSNIETSNGIVHVVNHPVLPPISAFKTLFLLPQYFSIATSAVQRVGLTDELDLHVRCSDIDDKTFGSCKFSGASSLTVFAPINFAFERLPFKLRLFLFSPAGSHVLKKLLQYHIVPDNVVFSDHQYKKSALTTETHEHPGHGKTVFERNLKLPTLLNNKTILTHVKQVEYSLPTPGSHHPSIFKTDVIANGHRVLAHDVVTSNAAVHVLDHVLDPRHKGDINHVSDWEDWEDWLLDWAN